MPLLSIIVPVYNEEKAIKPFYEKLVKTMSESDIKYELIYVNDGSTDGSGKILDDLDVRVFHFKKNIGYGGALKYGIRQAKGEFIAIIDCDGTYEPEDIVKLYPEMQDCEMVVGQRPKDKGLRFLVKGFLNHFASYAATYPIPDLNSGLRIFRRDMALELSHILPNGFSFTSTITLGALYIPLRVKYIPITYNDRTGSSKIKPFRAFGGFLVLIIRTIILFNPLKFFLPAAAFMGFFGIIFLIRDIFARNLAQSSLLMLVNAFILLAIGLLAEAIRTKK